MNSARIAWFSVSIPRSISVPSRTKAGTSGAGTTAKPRRSAGASVLLKVPQ